MPSPGGSPTGTREATAEAAPETTGLGAFARMVDWESARLSRLMSAAGLIGNPSPVARRFVSAALVAAALAVPAAALLGMLVSPVLALVALAPMAVWYFPEFRLKDAASKRKEEVDRSLPFFSILVNVMGGAGMPLFSIFEEASDTDLFPALKTEALQVIRDVKVFGMDTNQAFERLAQGHPSRRFSSFLNGYTSKVRSGGDMASYLSGASQSMIKELQERWGRYADRAGIVGSLMITVFGVLPLLLMVTSIFSPSASITGLVAFTLGVVPLFTLLLVLMAGRIQPSWGIALSGGPRKGLLVSAAAAGVGAFLGSLWMTVALGLSGFFFTYGLTLRAQIREVEETEAALPEFMKDVLEFKRQEYGLPKALMAISASNRYNRTFDGLLKSVVAQVRAGTQMEEVRVRSSSRLAKMTFFVLGQMAKTGGGTVDTVFQMLSHTTSVVEAKRGARTEMRPYMVLSYLSPLMLAFGVTFVRGILSSFGSTFRPGSSSASIPVLQVGVVPQALTQVSDLLIVVSAAALGLIGAKLTDFTAKNTLRPATNLVVSVTAMALLSQPLIQGLLRL